jgi:hypothetical protein
VSPSDPEFVSLKDTDACKKCIVGSDKDTFEVYCKTSGGTPLVDVNVAVGDESFKALQSDVDPSVYIAFINLANHHHNATITCSVMNGALISPLITSAKVYVISK